MQTIVTQPRITRRLCESGILPDQGFHPDCPNVSTMDGAVDGVPISLCAACHVDFAAVLDPPAPPAERLETARKTATLAVAVGSLPLGTPIFSEAVRNELALVAGGDAVPVSRALCTMADLMVHAEELAGAAEGGDRAALRIVAVLEAAIAAFQIRYLALTPEEIAALAEAAAVHLRATDWGATP